MIYSYLKPIRSKILNKSLKIKAKKKYTRKLLKKNHKTLKTLRELLSSPGKKLKTKEENIKSITTIINIKKINKQIT